MNEYNITKCEQVFLFCYSIINTGLGGDVCADWFTFIIIT